MKMPRPTLDEYYLALLPHVAGRSTCARRAVGAILVDGRGRQLGAGYNGVPRQFKHCVDVPCPGARDAKGDTARCEAVHAEVNALLNASSLELARTLYVSCVPCFQCAKIIANTEVERVVALEAYADPLGLAVLQAADIEVEIAG